MSDVVERFRVELERFGDDDEGAAALRSLFEDEVLPHVRELRSAAFLELWQEIEAAMDPPAGERAMDTAGRAADLIRVAREFDGEVGSREALREVAGRLGLPADVSVPTVVARAQSVVAAVQAGVGAQVELVGRFADAAGVPARADVTEVVAAVGALRVQADERGRGLADVARAAGCSAGVEFSGLRIRLGADGGLDLDERDRSMLREIGEGRLWRCPDGAGNAHADRDGMLSSSQEERLGRLVAAGLVEVEDTEDPRLTEHGRAEVEVPSPVFTAGVGLSSSADGRPRTAADVQAEALGEITRLVFDPNPDAVGAARVVEPYPGAVVARVRAIVEALVEIAALPEVGAGMEPFEPTAGAVRSQPDFVTAAVAAALRRPVGEVELVAVPSPDVVLVARVMELLRAADDLHGMPVGGGWWAQVSRERERVWVAAWLTRRAREVMDAPVGGSGG